MHSTNTGADPGFPVGGGANSPVGHQHMIWPNFMKNCVKLRKFWAVGEGARQGRAPKSTTVTCNMIVADPAARLGGDEKHELYGAALGSHIFTAQVMFLHMSIFLSMGGGVSAGIHTPLPSACWDTVNKQVVRIPLEGILGCDLFFAGPGGHGPLPPWIRNCIIRAYTVSRC